MIENNNPPTKRPPGNPNFRKGVSGHPQGRPKGSPNKMTTVLKDAILEAAIAAGNGDLVEFLRAQAIANPGPFLTLLGKVLPLTLAGDPAAPAHLTVTWLPPTLR